MINYISKPLVNEILVSYMCGYDGENYDIISALRDVSAKINEAPSADVQPVDRWISVKDRLPKIGEQVLVCDKFNQIDKMEYCGNGLWSRNDFTYKANEKHFWQPLPEPPKNR